MAWLLFAFSGPLLWGVSFHLDKYLVDRYFQQIDTAVLLVFTALIAFLLLPLILYWQPATMALSQSTILVLMLSGIGSMAAMALYLRALRTEDIAVVAPLFQMTPIFVFVLGYVALGETVSRLQAVGAVLIMAGTVTLSWSDKQSGFKFRLVLLMVLCTATLAAATVLFKIFAIRGGYWSTTFWIYAGEVVFGVFVLFVPAYRRQFRHLFRTHPIGLCVLNGANELINLGGALGARYALLLAPMGLVQAIGSTTSLFVFLLGLVLAGLGRRADLNSLSSIARVRTGVGAILVTIGTALCVIDSA